jgi:hypothetical protein
VKKRKSKAQLQGRSRRNVGRATHATLAETVLLQPWFLPQRVAFAMHSLVPVAFWRKMRNVFDDYGCLICGAEANYHSNGMCTACYRRTRKKVLRSARRHATQSNDARLDLELFRQQNLARKLLSRFVLDDAERPKSKRIGIVQHNPVYEALAAKLEQSRRSI